MLLALVKMKKFDKIEQYFPIRGHSFLPCDRDFSQIKRRLKKFDRIYSVRQLIQIILSCSPKNPQKFTVKLVEADEILDFKGWWPTHFKRNPVSVETSGRKVKKEDKVYFGISSFHYFSYTSNSPGVLRAYTFIDGLVFHTFNMSKNTVLEFPIQKAYPTGKVPLKKSKIDDVVKLQPYIPEKYMQFYVTLINWPTIADEEDEIVE